MRPALEYASSLRPDRADSITDSIIQKVLKVLYRVRRTPDVEDELNQAVRLVPSLPLPPRDREAVGEHLGKACRFARSGEIGAACWELRASLVYLVRQRMPASGSPRLAGECCVTG